MRILIPLILLVLAGCPTHGKAPGDTGDADGDGHASPEDCDDTDAAIHPGAAEVCDDIDNNCDGFIDEEVKSTFYADSDQDGYGAPKSRIEACEADEGMVANSVDCDDLDPSTNPYAAETCDERDNDCDGTVDDGVTRTLYEDADGDGYGNPSVSLQACGPSGGIVEDRTDCDDANPMAWPGAVEFCDGSDNDCDFSIDEADAVDSTTWYHDGDADGWGDSEDPLDACDPPGGYLADGTDCDDTNDAIHPTADEVCGDSRDDDCDGSIDEGDAVDATTWYPDQDGDGWGDSRNATRSCAILPWHVLVGGDCDDGDLSVSPDAVETCDGQDDDCDGSTDEADAADAPIWYADSDRDGYGNPSSSVRACTAPVNTTADATDCDDTQRGIHPGVTELCDGIDQDCDGTIDEEAAGGLSYYLDADGDSYGNPLSTLTSCIQPSGYVANSTDCDDTNAAINPLTQWWEDWDGDGYGNSASSPRSGCQRPSTYYTPVGGDCDDYDFTAHPNADEICTDGCVADQGDDDCDGVADEGCPLIHGATITASETWSSSQTHLVACDVRVDHSNIPPILTIEAGTRVEFANGVSLRIGSSGLGELHVEGTASDPVVFTGQNQTPGSWSGLFVEDGSYDTVIENLQLSCGGGDSYYNGNINLLGATGTRIIDSVIEDSAGFGLYVNSSDPLVTGTTIRFNAGVGLYCPSDVCLDSRQGSFTDNVVTENGGFPVEISASAVSALDASSSFATPASSPYYDAAYDYVAVTSSTRTLSSDATWQDLGLPYYVAGQVYVESTSDASQLVIEDGVSMYFGNSAGIWVGTNSDGDLWIDAPVEGVTMRPYGSRWYGLVFGPHANDLDSWLHNVTIEGAGAGASPYDSSLTVYSNHEGIAFEDCTFRDSLGSGARVYNGSSAVFQGCTFEGSADYGVRIDDDTSELAGVFSGNTITGSGSEPITLPATSVGLLDTSSTFGDPATDHIRVTSYAPIATDTTWRDLGTPYHITESFWVYDFSTSPTLTIEDGVEMYFDDDKTLYVGYAWYSNYYANLVIDGDRASGEGVLLTSYRSQGSAPGTWHGLLFGSGATGTLSGFTLQDAGGDGSYPAGIYMTGGDVDLSDCVVEHNEAYGIYVTQTARFGMTDCTVSHTEASNPSSPTDGDGVYLNSYVAIDAWSSNVLSDNDGYAVTLAASQMTSLDTASDYESGNGQPFVRSTGGSATASGIWADIPWVVSGDLYIAKNDSAAPPTITITSGTTMRFGQGVQLHVGYDYWGNLVADGVTFTDAAGDWCGIILGFRSSRLSSITNSVIENGGASAGCSYAIPSTYADLSIYLSQANVSANQILGSLGWGAVCNSYSGTSAISTANTFTGNSLGNTYGCP